MSSPPDEPTRAALTAAHARAAGFLDLRCTGPIAFGTSGTTAGRRADHLWLRVSRSSRTRAPRPTGQGALGAEQLLPDSVLRPRIHRTVDWIDGEHFYKGDLADFAGTAISTTPDLRHDPGLDDTWWHTLKTALADTATATGTKATPHQAWIDKNIPQYLGIPAPTGIERVTGHGDLQWANLTQEPLALLDWERWGLVPIGYDPAMLWANSLQVPAIADRIRTEFADTFASSAGRVGELIALAEMLQAVDRGYYPGLAPLLADRARELIGATAPPTGRHGPGGSRSRRSASSPSRRQLP
ncbi:hypothetical protein HUT16_17210 [Kitasatospora sp. NA04385]|uniref:phosphotransferase n=1 Tax=Kitasatospora sp. NA04385 TaxID=2742135 RepID=UPI00159279A1|nr:phosphotransferase [Kitasatospora sp. NA04385]QKW20577.1 hypothetical protein HUT16_17210 [Kitasatospora sp. NA04385]